MSFKKYAKYADQILKNLKPKKEFEYMLQKIEDNYDKIITEWTNEDVDKFMFDCHSTSNSTVGKYLWMVRSIHQEICKIENIPYNRFELLREQKEYIDIERLAAETINWQQYNYIRDKLIVFDENNKKINTRNKLIFELSWEGLPNEEIRELKEDDIEFIYNENNEAIKASLTIRNDDEERYVVIDDVETVQDIVRTKNETHMITTKGRNYKRVLAPYKQTEYLIKPTEGKRNSKEETMDQEFVRNPSMILYNYFERNVDEYVNVPGNVDISKLSIASIRRSRMIYEITNQGKARKAEDFSSVNEIQMMFDKKSFADLMWLPWAIEKMIQKGLY